MNEKDCGEKNQDLESQSVESRLETSEKQKEIDHRLRKHGYDGAPKTPSTDDRAAVLGPDDTSPGSGPYRPEER